MKLQLICLVLAGLCLVNAEITPRFPGVQPIILDGTGAPPSGSTEFEIKRVIDSFEQDTTPPLVIVIATGGAPPTQTQSAFDSSSTIIGGERDVVLTAEQGPAGRVLTAGASDGVFSLATPNGSSGFALLQYDGTDGSVNLDTAVGLNQLDLTENNAIGFQISALADITTVFGLRVVDASGNEAQAQASVPGGVELAFYQVFFTDFTGVDFSRINAIEFQVEAFENVDFTLETFVTFGAITIQTGDCFEGAVLPCDTDYYRIQQIADIKVGDYIYLEFNSTGELAQPNTQTSFYVSTSPFDNLQAELESNENIIDTLGALPGPNNYIYKCTGYCEIEIVWSALIAETYYLAVEGQGNGVSLYTICIGYRNVPVFQLLDSVVEPIFFDQRPDYPPNDRVTDYRYYVIDVPRQRFNPGTYLTVNVSRVEPFPGSTIRLMYESLPEAAEDTGIIGTAESNSIGQRVDNMVYPYCVNTKTAGRLDYEHPVKSDPRVPCQCDTEVQLFGNGPLFQLTCQLTVDPCNFKYGNWYISVELPPRVDPYVSSDLSARLNYTIGAFVVQPVVNELERNQTIKGFVEPEAMAHFFINVAANDMTEGESHFMVHLSNVRNGFVDIYVHQGLGIGRNLAGGREGCVPANATCHTCDACNVIIEKCHFVPGDWFISVGISYDEVAGDFEVFDVDRLPITYTIRANWLEDSAPERLVAGVPVSKYIGEALYDFYVIDVPPTIDTWLFVELFTCANDTEVILSILHGELPGGECYSRPDFYCMTGDPRGLRWSTGTPTFYDNEPVQRESCTFMIQTCELSAGPLFLSVYGHHTGYAAYGDNTFYQVPVHYTLWADFDVALALTSGASYSETVFTRQYQHYYIRADQIRQGSSLSVEVTNIRHAIPQSVEVFVNYNYLAGNCPCYDHLYNCTGTPSCSNVYESGAIPYLNERYAPYGDTTVTCCTIVVPPSDFRPGVWYVSVLGVNEDYYQYTTPIGYTLTVTIHDAPTFNPLVLGQTYSGEVPQWNKTLEYSHFRLAADALPLSDLVVKVTFVQNCEFLGKTDDHNTRYSDSVWMFINKGAPASALGWDYTCEANIPGDSFCTIVIPHCEWSGDDYFIAVQGDYSSDFTGRFTIRAFIDEIRDEPLTDGVAHYDRVAMGRYKHYFISTTAEEDQNLSIDIYTNHDQDAVTAYLNKDERAGDAPCFRNQDSCTTKSCCHWQILACDMEPGRYYISVYGVGHQFYDTSVEYTITASHKPVSIRVFNNQPLTAHLYSVGEVQHYSFEIGQVPLGEYLLFTVDNIKHGSIQAFMQYGFLAGRCPCFIWERTCTPAADADWCEIRVPSCELHPGTYFFSVFATEKTSPDPPVFATPIGYIVQASITTPRIVTPVVAVGRNSQNFEPFEFIANSKYVHYRFQTTQADFANGYHINVEIINVDDGALFVFYNPISPADADGCHLAQICTSGLGTGAECHWQLPYCLVRPLDADQFHYISIEGRTARQVASYSILIFKQQVPTILPNAVFSLDDDDTDAIEFNSLSFPVGVELNVTHRAVQEPNGWTQFVRLPDVSHPDSERGDMLELFFYRITNNIGEPMSFNVYVAPNKPAGAHECCAGSPSELGSCQGAPCSESADTTVSNNLGPDVFSHTCSLGDGVGVDHDDIDRDPFFGERCTVRVWPCEFNKYCEDLTDWFVSIVPLAPTDPTTSGPGLQYSMQWRTRNIRQSENGTIGSIDLTTSINTYTFTRSYSLFADTTENQAWRSFYVDWSSDNGRLSIQTEFLSGAGTVYINGDEFASATESCYDYVCSSGDPIDCSGAGRFIATECCSQKYSRYWITVQNTGPVDSTTEVAFRIVSIALPATFVIPSHPPQSNPFVATSGQSVFANINGVEGNNYDFYSLTIDDDDLDRHQSWVVLISLDDTDANAPNDYQLHTHIRFGAEAGHYGPDSLQSSYGDAPEGCHMWTYSCDLTVVDQTCVYQIPHCALVEGHWFISIENPDFHLSGIPSDLPSYSLATYISNMPVPVGLDEQVFNDGASSFGLLSHFSVNITADNIDFDDRSDFQGYWVKYLRFQLDNILTPDNNIGSVRMWVNYGYNAGPSSEFPCLGAFDVVDCVGGSCFVDVTPCEFDGSDIKLKTGVYYVAVRQTVPSTYSLLARVYRNEYQPVAVTQTIAGAGHRLGATDTLWRWVSTDNELTANGDGEGNYRYVIDPVEGDDDDLADNFYYSINITATSTWSAGATADLQVWRDDCTRWECSLSGPDSWCTIDAVGLAPCSGKAGRFFFRVVNPTASPFTLDFFRNETTIQTLRQDQIITEIVYPYEYQEYYFEAFRVGEGATLNVKVCSICGDVQAFIRPDLPAGPGPAADGAPDSCAIDTCTATGPDDTTFAPENNCCNLFIDECVYEQRGYYIGIRGVDTTYPGAANEHLYLPAKYNIQAHQTIVNTTDISFASCPKTIRYYESWDVVPRQYAIDIETVNVGTILRFSLRVNPEYAQAATRAHLTQATLWAQPNTTIGFTQNCYGETPFCTTLTECVLEIPYCAIAQTCGGRYYIWAQAPRGSEIVVERWDPSVPILSPNLHYSATINGPESGSVFDLPMTPNHQIYRFDISPPIGDENFYEKFLARIYFRNVNQGRISAYVNSGYMPWSDNDDCTAPAFLENTACTSVGAGEECFIEMQFSDLLFAAGGDVTAIPEVFWLTVVGEAQDCELHSIQYSFVVQTLFTLTYFPLGTTVCDSVAPGEYNLHRLRPNNIENPQESILNIRIADLDGDDESVELLLRDGYLATTNGAFSWSSDGQNSFSTNWLCGYNDLYMSVYGLDSTDGEIDYRITVDKIPIRIKELFDDSTYHHDDDDDDACPHDYDFYVFKTAQPLGHHEGSFFRVAVDSEFPTTVYVNKGTVAWTQCADSGSGSNDPTVTGTTTVNVYDFCNFHDGLYFITVVADGPYYIYTDIRDDAVPLTVGDVFRDTLEPAMYQVYTLEICSDWFEADDRLVVEISDVEHGSVYGWIRYEGTPGESCHIDSALAEYGPGESGYDFLLVNHCELKAGTYQILIRASPHQGSPERDCQHVNYRLFPYLIDYDIEATEITANVVITDVVDQYTINRIVPGSVSYANYYLLHPLMEMEGYYEQISHAVARLINVEGGHLRLRVMCGHLATAEFGYINGEIYGLTKTGLIDPDLKMQSGSRPFNWQQIMDPRQSNKQQGCDGCSDFCCEMSFDDIPQYRQDKSCAVWIPSCYLIWAEFYLAVEPVEQFYQDHPIQYDLLVHQSRDYILLQPNTHKVSSFENDNWDYRFYYSISSEAESMRWRVVVTEGEGVLVTVRNHRCPLQADWVKELWCDADYFEHPWMCDIEIPTRASHPGDNAYFIAVYGKNATYSLAFWRGNENCHAVTGSGRNDGLDFCAGLVPYNTWRWDSYNNLDHEAHCLFEQLYDHFRVQPCWSGVSVECNSTLQAFACYESFHRCDAQGFMVGTCRDACDAVVYECVNWFESVDLEHYNCTSHRYLDSRAQTCTGNNDFISFNDQAKLFLGEEPELLLYASNSSMASTLTFNVLVAFVAVLAFVL